MKLFKKILKIVGAIFVLLLVTVYILFVNFSSPKSDIEIAEEFENSIYKPIISKEKYKNFEFRKLSMQSKIDTTKYTLVFVHGAIGSSLDFKKYMSDSLLNSKANMISYDRIGYNYEDKHLAQKSIDFEVAILKEVLKEIDPKKTILIGYSYGGPITLALKEQFKKIVLLAPAVYSVVEPMPWMVNFYKWKATRWLVPHSWKSASEEKITHQAELQKYENTWSNTPSQVISIHGDSDQIVPYENSLFLEQQFPEKQFKLVTIPKAGHGLVWSNFDFIKEEFLKVLD